MPCCLRCAGEKVVRGPGVYTEIVCPTCLGSGDFVEPDERPTLKPPPKPPDNRPTPKVELVPCPSCVEGRALYQSPLGVTCERECQICKGEREIHPAVALEFSRRK